MVDRPAQSLLAQLGGLLPEPVLLIDRQGAVRDANTALCRMLGRQREDLIGAAIADLVHDDHDKLADLLRLWARSRDPLPGVLAWRTAGDAQHIRCDGAATGLPGDDGHALIAIRCRTQAAAVRQFTVLGDRIAALTREIRRRHAVELELRAQREWLAVVLRSIGDAVIATDARGRVAFMNPVAEALTGRTIDNAAGQPIADVFDIVNEHTRLPVESPVERVLREGATVGLANHTVVRRPDGTETPIDDSGAPIRADDGEIEGAVLVFRDITQRQRAEAALREREQLFRAMADSAPVLVWVAGPDRACTWFNRPWLEFTGRTLDQEAGDGWTDGVHPDDFDRCTRDFAAAFEAREQFRTEFRLRRSDGVFRWVQNHGRPTRDASGAFAGFVGSCIDVTDHVEARRTLENHRAMLENEVRERTVELHASYDRLRATERLASLGTLSAGLGHDIGNLLLPMRARLDAIRRDGLAPSMEDHLQVIEQCLEYLRRLTGGLRLLSLDPASTAHAADATELHAWWREIDALLRSVLPAGVELRCHLPPHPLAVRLARAPLTQVVFNLVQNAGEALRGRDDGIVECAAAPNADGSVTLTVADNGPGMAEDVRLRCLEPFFTTRTREFSTGLGLALAHGVVVAAGGRIDVDSAPGRGSRFAVRLPAAHAPAEPREPDLPAAVTVADPRLRGLVASSLAEMNCSVADQPPAAPGARLWVLDGAACPSAVRRFLDEDPAARAVVVGAAAAPFALTHDRLVNLADEPRASVLRQRLRSLTQQLAR